MRLRTFDGGGRLGVGSRSRCRENHSALQLQLQTPTHHPPISKINRRTTGDLRHAPLDAYSIAKSAPFGSGFCGEKRNLSGLIAGEALTPPLRARVSAALLRKSVVHRYAVMGGRRVQMRRSDPLLRVALQAS